MVDLDSLATDPWQTIGVARLVSDRDVAHIVARHGLIRELCDALESCADHLPNMEAIEIAAIVSAALALQLHIDDARGADLPRNGIRNRLLDRIGRYKALDSLHADDLHDTLIVAQANPGSIPAETLGYMMRCLFDGCRRAIDLQEMALLLAPGHVTVKARKALGASLNGPLRAAATPANRG